MKILSVCAGLLLALVGVMPLAAQASPVLKSGDEIVIDATKEVRGNFYAAGGTVSVAGPVLGDMYVAAGTVTITAPISSDVGIAGGTVRIASDIKGDLRVAGGDVSVDGVVGGELMVTGGTVHILPTAKIQGDIIVYAGTVTVDGPVSGSIYGSVGKLTLNSKIEGSVLINKVDTLTLGASAHVLGDFEYTSASDVSMVSGAVIEGETLHHGVVPLRTDWSGIVLTFFALYLLATVAFVLFRKQLPDLVSRTTHHMGLYALIGAGVCIATPVVALLLMVSGVALPVGVFILATYVMLLIAATALLAHSAGASIVRAYTRKLEVTWVTTLVGSVLLVLLYFVPLLALLAIIVPLGSISRELYVTFFNGIQLRRRK